MSDEQVTSLGESSDGSVAPALLQLSEPVTHEASPETAAGETIEHILRTRLPEELAAVPESPDPVAGLDHAVQTVADELSRHSAPAGAFENAAGPGDEIADAIETLVRVALEMDDPVAALEEGAESLAEALTARDLAGEEQRQAAGERWADQLSAYQHARFHRVSELVDVGYSLDQAVAITNANEMEIRDRAAADGSDPMEAIYRYAVLNGYQGRPAPSHAVSQHQRALVEYGDESGDPAWELADLARLNDEAFAEATRGDRWRALMRP